MVGGHLLKKATIDVEFTVNFNSNLCVKNYNLNQCKYVILKVYNINLLNLFSSVMIYCIL